MATNYRIRVNLLKLQGAFIKDIQGKSETKRCIVIPVDAGGMFLGDKGCYLSLAAIEMREPKFNDTHCVKPALSKDALDVMTPDQKANIPILGGLRAVTPAPERPSNHWSASDFSTDANSGDLPF